MIAEVIIQSNVKNLNKVFDYKIPDEYEENWVELIGARVLVPFGKMKTLEEGFIVNIKKSTDYKVKEIAKVQERYLNRTKINLARWMAKRYFCNVSDCLKLMLPPGTSTKISENRVKDALKKIDKLPEIIKKDSHFHLIGHLQTNKVKLAVGNFDLIHSVDSVKLAKEINEEAKKKGIIQKILLQINNAREDQKSGFLPEEIKSAFKEINSYDAVKICGLMNMAPINATDEELHYLFKNIKQINDVLQSEFGVELKQISMGMSRDFRIALEEGATMIRLGRILFE